jgi:hypothetical protein
MDDWEFNEEGELTCHDADDKSRDAIRVMNADGSVKSSVTLDAGSITKGTVSIGYGTYKESYDKYTINGKDNALETFNMLADNTSREWALSVYQEGTGTANYLTTNDNSGVSTEIGSVDLFDKQFSKGNSLITHTHSHPEPLGIPYPSALFPTNGEKKGDIISADYWANQTLSMPNAVAPRFFLRASGKNIEYTTKEQRQQLLKHANQNPYGK